MRLLNIGRYQTTPYPLLWHRSLIVALAIIALVVTTLFIAAASPETITYQTEELGAKADGFWAPEFNGERFYRWTQGIAYFDLPALDGATQIAVAVSLSAPQHPEAPPVAATITAGAQTSMRFDIAPEWRTYHLLIDPGASRRTPSFKLTTATWRAPRDERDLGVLVGHLTASRLLPPPPAVIVERWLFLASLVALIALATRHIRPVGMVPFGALALLAGLALWAPARLVQWLPVNWWVVIGLTLLVLLNEGIRRYHPETLERVNRIGLSIVLGMAWTLTSITHVLMPRLADTGTTLLSLVVGLAVIFSALAYRLIGAVIPRLQAFGRNAQIAWLLSALLLGALATLVIPTFPPPLWHPGERSLGLLSAYALPQQEHSAWLLYAIQGALWTADIISFGVLLTSALLLLSVWQSRAQPFALGWYWYALPCVLVWSITLLAFWPGLVAEDPINQWTQILSNRYDDTHPAFHTLTIKVITLLWLSPAVVALTQIGAMALAFGLTLRELALLGTSKWAQAFLTALFALSPVNNTMVITVWKDIPYAIALLFLFWMLLRVWRTDGAWLQSRRAWASIGVALAALALYRHNGAPTALLILPAFLIVGQRAHWRQIAGISCIALALVLLVKVGVYRALEVAPAAPWFVRQSLIHQIGAFLTDPDARISADDRRHIERLGGGNDEWRRMYSCYQLNSLLYGGAFDYDYFDAHVSAIDAVWLRLAMNNPMTLVRHQACLTSLIWRVTQPGDGYLFTYYPGAPEHIQYLKEFGERFARFRGLDPDITEIYAPASLLPEVREALIPRLQALERPEWIWLTWRPALYLYLALFCVTALAIRHRSWRTAGLALPVAAQSMVWMLLLTVQDFRFQYPVYVVSLMMVGLLFVPSMRHSPEPEVTGDPGN